MFVLRALDPDNKPLPAEKWQFARLPIRIGRNTLNDYCIRHEMISSFHARLEEIDGKLCVRDMASKNGVYVASSPGVAPRRIEKNGVAELAPAGMLFFLSWHVRIHVEVLQGELPVRSALKTGMVLGNIDMLAMPGPTPGAGQRPSAAPAGPGGGAAALFGPGAVPPGPPPGAPPPLAFGASPTPSAAPPPFGAPGTAPPGPGAPSMPPFGPGGARSPSGSLPAAGGYGPPPLGPIPSAPPVAGVPPLGTSAPPPFGGPAPLVGPFPPPAVPSFGGPPVAPGPSPLGALPPIGSVPGTASPSQPPPIDPYAAAARPPSAPPYGGAYPAAPPPPAGGGASPSAPPRAEGGLHTGAFQLDMPTLALQGLRELASSLVPGRPLETTGDVVRLITKLHDTVDVFCRSFIPLRQGYAQFLSSLDLQRAAQQRAMNRSNAALTLESATTPQVLAMALLDPRDPSVDAPEAVEGILADLMLHQVALLDGVMEGVRALLDELSPTSIDAALAQKGGAGPFQAKHRARWDEFCARFERLSDERQAFSVIFGQSFADVYRQYWHRKAAEDRGLRSDPPRG